jgi:lipopolysaccharide transport system permease protein
MQPNPFYVLYSHRELLLAWTMRSIRVRYQQSILGGLWAIIQPAASAVVFSVIFTLFIPINTGGVPYILFSYVAMVPWSLFSSSISDMIESLVGNMNLVSKIYFPREILPISALLSRLFDFAIASILIAVLLFIFKVPLFPLGLLFLPLILLIQLLLALGLGLAGAALNVFYRDIRHVFTLVLQIWFYATPVIYPITTVPEHFRPYYYINPMAGVMVAYRSVLLYHQYPGSYLLISGFSAIIIFLIGYWFFKRIEFQFADVI